MVIVTKNQYILASKIHHITMDEHINYADVRSRNGAYLSVKELYYTIHIVYSPEVTSSNSLRNSEETRESTVKIRGAVDAHKVFQNLIQQIREQMPDQLFLDKALDQMLSSVDMVSLEDLDLCKDETFPLTLNRRNNDRSTKKVRKSRKTKRTSKKVLRRVK